MKQMYCHGIGRFYGSIFFQVLVDDDAQEAIMLHRTPIRFEILLKQLGTIFLLSLDHKKVHPRMPEWKMSSSPWDVLPRRLPKSST